MRRVKVSRYTVAVRGRRRSLGRNWKVSLLRGSLRGGGGGRGDALRAVKQRPRVQLVAFERRHEGHGVVVVRGGVEATVERRSDGNRVTSSFATVVFATEQSLALLAKPLRLVHHERLGGGGSLRRLRGGGRGRGRVALRSLSGGDGGSGDLRCGGDNRALPQRLSAPSPLRVVLNLDVATVVRFGEGVLEAAAFRVRADSVLFRGFGGGLGPVKVSLLRELATFLVSGGFLDLLAFQTCRLLL